MRDNEVQALLVMMRALTGAGDSEIGSSFALVVGRLRLLW